MFKKIQKIHMIGIGGSGMSGIAEVLLKRNYEVSGSDLHESDTTRRLQELGARLHIGHSAEEMGEPHVVVTSSAVAADNPEVIEAQRLKIPVIPRVEMLAELMRMQYGIAVAGAHGKTTTTSLILSVLQAGGLDPTAIIGGRLNSIGSNATLGKGELIVVEADESDGSFLRLTPTLAVITNIDREHLNHYGDMPALQSAFVQFANSVPFYGASIVCKDDPGIEVILSRVNRRLVTYGLHPEAQVRGEILKRQGVASLVRVFRAGKLAGELHVPIPGRHNVQNALAAVAVGFECQLPFEKIKEGLAAFTGIQRRLEKKGESRGVAVVDDYGHHPQEIRATLSALRDVYEKKRLVVVFQPHRYTRLKDLFEEFSEAFGAADVLFLLPVYAAGEKPLPGFDSQKLAQRMREKQTLPIYDLQNKEEAFQALEKILQPNDILLTLGAGDVWKLGMEWMKGER